MMACLSPIWIRNRRFYDSKNPCRSGSDYARSSLALRPWDISRQYLQVPCGKCAECLRRARNDWFVRIERELARSKAFHTNSVFITITIAPKYYNQALLDPSSFIRRWNERIRHRLGHSFKHCFFQEFGCHPETGGEPRLHFHGFLFNVDLPYQVIHSAVRDLGFVWISRATHKRARYCVKYVVKQIEFDRTYADNYLVSIDGRSVPLSNLLQHRRYARKFVSSGLGDYLGLMPRPSFSTSSWSYLDFKSGVNYTYSIPRYYNRYLEQKDEFLRQISSAYTYSLFSRSALVRDCVAELVKRFMVSTSVSFRNSYEWQLKKIRTFTLKSLPSAAFEPPAWLDLDILSFWRDNFQFSFLV
ncbi:replication initiator protein [Dipodfec virus UOA04_Rod_653]|nr:replication initiator protein [Dipodfec virus UOA04_Rod_653]